MSDLPSLLPPNSGAIERDLEQVMTRLQRVSIPLTTLWNPDTCPEHLLPYLAWAMSIEVWDDTWSAEQKRAAVKSSVAVHRVKGTRGAVERALGALGFAIDLTEWFESGDPVHTFRLDAFGEDVFAAGFEINAALFATVTRVIENVKPVRSHFTLRIGERFDSGVAIHAGSRLKLELRATHDPMPGTNQSAAELHLGSGVHIVLPSEESHEPLPRGVAPAASMGSGSAVSIHMIDAHTHQLEMREVA